MNKELHNPCQVAQTVDGMKIANFFSWSTQSKGDAIMCYDANVLLACVHLYSAVGDRKKSRYYDKLFVHMMKQSINRSFLDSRQPLE